LVTRFVKSFCRTPIRFGAFVGPLLAIVLMLRIADHIRTVLWFAVVPAFIATGLIKPRWHAALFPAYRTQADSNVCIDVLQDISLVGSWDR
jgi:hypothetical protein